MRTFQRFMIILAINVPLFPGFAAAPSAGANDKALSVAHESELGRRLAKHMVALHKLIKDETFTVFPSVDGKKRQSVSLSLLETRAGNIKSDLEEEIADLKVAKNKIKKQRKKFKKRPSMKAGLDLYIENTLSRLGFTETPEDKTLFLKQAIIHNQQQIKDIEDTLDSVRSMIASYITPDAIIEYAQKYDEDAAFFTSMDDATDKKVREIIANILGG